MKRTAIPAAFLILLSHCSMLLAAVTVSPDTVKVPYNRTSSKTVRYTVGDVDYCDQGRAESEAIEVWADGSAAMTIPKILSISLKNGAGTASETVRVTPAIVNFAREHGTTSVIYRRTFAISCGVPPETELYFTESTDLHIDMTTQAASDFAINRIELFFDGNTPYASVAMHDRINAYARISFNGSGLMQGYWQVDGHPYPPVVKTLSGRESVVLKFSGLQSLPTFNPGSHRVEFVVTSPAASFSTPYALYLVGHTSEEMLMPLALTSPKNDAILFPETAIYRWATNDKAVSYLIEFFEFGKTEPLFSAYTKNGNYALPSPIRKKAFEAGRHYFWRITGYDEEGNSVAKSSARTFQLIVN